MEYKQFDENIFCDSDPTKEEIIPGHECENQVEEENKAVRRTFNLDNVLEFTKAHRINVLTGEDWQYYCYIDGHCYDISLTPLMALINAISKYELDKNNRPTTAN